MIWYPLTFEEFETATGISDYSAYMLNNIYILFFYLLIAILVYLSLKCIFKGQKWL